VHAVVVVAVWDKCCTTLQKPLMPSTKYFWQFPVKIRPCTIESTYCVADTLLWPIVIGISPPSALGPGTGRNVSFLPFLASTDTSLLDGLDFVRGFPCKRHRFFLL
jgi:hypothetical protein